MKGNFAYIPAIILMMALGLSGCFEEDLRITPHTPGDEQVYVFEKSIYTDQMYFDLGTNRITGENENSAWSLRFGAQPGDWHIGVNTADYWAVFNPGTTDPDSIPANTGAWEWTFGSSSGHPDSTAFAGWVSFTGSDTLYSHYLYLLGRYDGIGYEPLKLLQFLSVSETGYTFRMRDWPAGSWSDYQVTKDASYNYSYLNVRGSIQWLQVEPPRDLWDLQFTQYGTIIFTNEGIPTPYYVRGVLLNPNGVGAALDSVNQFADISFEDLSNYRFSTRNDFIGYEWKDVEVDVNSNTAVYTVNTAITYIIRDAEGYCHKLRFTGFYNDFGEKGYPSIEHIRL